MSLVFDTQALIAFFFDEDGADVAEAFLNRVIEGAEEAWIHDVNLMELRYILLRHAPERADALLEWLDHAGVRPVGTGDTWREAADVKAAHGVSLGDAFALATARVKGARVLTADDPDFDAGGTPGIPVERVRDPT